MTWFSRIAVLAAMALCASTVMADDIAVEVDQFSWLMKQHDYQKAKALFDKWLTANARSEAMKSVLRYYIQNDRSDEIKLLIEWGVKPTLAERLSACPRERFSEGMRIYIGDLFDLCRCVPPAKVFCDDGEGTLMKWCGKEARVSMLLPESLKIKKGLVLLGDGACEFGVDRVWLAEYYRDGKLVRKFEEDEKTGVLKSVPVK